MFPAASVNAVIGWANLSSYAANKHAVLGLCRSAAKEYPGIRTNAVSPGMLSLCKMLNVVAFLLSDEASFVTGGQLPS